jgi:branched-chain amino acid transport system substrate-binding protein
MSVRLMVRLVAVVSVLALVGTACGSRTSKEEVRALLQPSGSTSDQAQSPGGDYGSAPEAASTPEADAPAAVAGGSSGAVTTPAAGSSGASARSGTGAAATQAGANTKAVGSAASPAAGRQGASTPSKSAAAPVPGAPAPAAAAGCTGSEPPIVIGTVGTTSGVLGGVYAAGFKALQAWAAGLNAKGGINCHKIKHLIADDGSDPARHQALVRRFVEQEKVIALLWQAAALSAQASKDYEIQNKVPVVSQDGGMFYFYDTPVHIPVGANGDVLQRVTVAAGALVAATKGKTKAAVLTCQEIEYCSVADKIFPDQAKQSGMQVVYQGKATLTQPDYTSQCLEAKNAGAEVFLTAFDGATDQRIMASCIKLGFRPILVASSNQQSNDWLSDPNMEGSVVGSSFMPWFLSQHPAIAEYQTTVKKFAPGSPFEASGIGAWSAAKTFEHIVRGIGPQDTPSSQKVFDGVYALKGDDLGGLSYPLRYDTNLPRKKIGCGWAVVNTGGKSTSDGKMFCIKGLEP